MNKKGQGLPITTIIIAILGLVVLVILFAILTGRLTIFAGAASECPGVCLVKEVAKDKDGTPLFSVQPGVLEERTECNEATEKRMYGRYIAGIRDKNEEPIACNKCCQRLG